MKAYRRYIRKYYKYIFRDWVRPNLNSNGELGKDAFAVAAKSTDGRPAWYAVDGSTGTHFSTAEYDPSEQWFTFYNPKPLIVTRLDINQAVEAYYYSKEIIVQGSNNNEDWTDITTWTGTSYTATFTIDMSKNTTPYTYYRLYCTKRAYYSSHYTEWRIVELAITATEKNPVESTIDDYDFYKDVIVCDVCKFPPTDTNNFSTYKAFLI